MTKDRDREHGTVPEIVLPEKQPVLTTAWAFEMLRAEARDAGATILDGPGFGNWPGGWNGNGTCRSFRKMSGRAWRP